MAVFRAAPFCAQQARSPAVFTTLRRCLAALIVPASIAQAQAPNPDGAVEEVIVTGARLEQSLPQELAQYGSRLTIVSSEQVRNGGYDDVSQVLQNLVPGLYVNQRNGVFDYVDASLQGSRTNEILWLVDGVRISNRLYNSITPFDTLPAHMIERVEVLEGGQGLFYGTQSVAGVVNVITKGYSETAGGSLNIGTDSNDGEHINGYFRDAVNERNQFVLFASSDQARGFTPFADEDYQPSVTDRHRRYDVTNLGAKFAHDFNDSLRLSVGYETIDARVDGDYPNTYQDAYNERDEDVFSSTLDYTPSDDFQFYAKTYFHQWDSYWTEYTVDPENPGALFLSSDRAFWGFKDYGLNALAKIAPGSKVDYYVGYDFQKYGGRDDVLLIAPNEERVHALFGQVRTTPELFENARIAIGLRRNMPSASQAETVWTASGQYDITPSLFVRGMLGTSFRLPDAYELFAVDLNCCVGNPNLEPESSENLNASIGGRLRERSGATWEVIYFRRYVDNLIADVDDGTGSGLTIAMNIDGEVKVTGAQVVLGLRMGDAVTSTVTYTRNESESLNNVTGSYDSLPGIPDNQLTANVEYSPAGKPFGFTVTVNRVGEVHDVVGGVGEVKRGDYTVVDAGARVYLDALERHRLNLRLENVFDETYTSRYSRGRVDLSDPPAFYPARNVGTPRTIHFGYSYSF